jgi:hypothetical protein
MGMGTKKTGAQEGIKRKATESVGKGSNKRFNFQLIV